MTQRHLLESLGRRFLVIWSFLLNSFFLLPFAGTLTYHGVSFERISGKLPLGVTIRPSMPWADDPHCRNHHQEFLHPLFKKLNPLSNGGAWRRGFMIRWSIIFFSSWSGRHSWWSSFSWSSFPSSALPICLGNPSIRWTPFDIHQIMYSFIGPPSLPPSSISLGQFPTYSVHGSTKTNCVSSGPAA